MFKNVISCEKKNNSFYKLYYLGIRTLRADAKGYYATVKSITIQGSQPYSVVFKLNKDERILNMPRMMFIVLTGSQKYQCSFVRYI